MPDISLCSNQFCPSKDKCYRFRAMPNTHRQSYASFKPEEGKKKCDHFMGILGSDDLQPIKDDKL